MSVADNQGTGHPSRHGYAKCARCGTWRMEGDVMEGDWTWDHEKHGPIRMDGPTCTDKAWCAAQLVGGP